MAMIARSTPLNDITRSVMSILSGESSQLTVLSPQFSVFRYRHLATDDRRPLTESLSYRKFPAAVKAQENLYQPVSDQLVQCKQFAVGACDRVGVMPVGAQGCAAGFERVGSFFN